MTGTLYINISDKRVINKTLNNPTSELNIEPFENCDIISPIFIIDYNINYFNYNYIFVPVFKRYYFINNIEIMNGRQLKLYCNVDVLESFKIYILNLRCIVSRQENIFNQYLDDTQFQIENRKQIQTKIITSSQFDG